MWHDYFDGFYDNWDHSFNIQSQSGRKENVRFIHKQTLFIGLNIVGGRRIDATEWNDRLTSNFEWTSDLIRTHVVNGQDANAVVIMAHATNTGKHAPFFHAMRDFIENELDNEFPILYMNGDEHVWNYEPNYFGQPNWLRITLDGECIAPPLKVTVNGTAGVSTVYEAFSYDRNLR